MQLTRHRRINTPSMNMTPMIDIVFLLLIFFITVSQVSKIEKERLQLPKLPGSEDQKPTSLIINVTQTGEVVVAGQTISVARLVSMVADEIHRLGDTPDLLTVVLRIDDRGTCQTLNEIVSALTQLEVTRIRIAVEVPDE